MIRALLKTGNRTGQFLGASLTGRLSERPYVIVAWGLVAGAVWLGGSLSDAPRSLELLASGFYLIVILAAICAIDARYGIIPNSLVAALAAGGLVQMLLQGDTGLLQRVIEALGVLAAGYLFRGLYGALRGQEGLGQGDLKFAAAGALWIGLEGIPGLLLVGVLSALASLLILRAQGYGLHRKLAISFGPHLALGLWLTWVLGPLHFGL